MEKKSWHSHPWARGIATFASGALAFFALSEIPEQAGKWGKFLVWVRDHMSPSWQAALLLAAIVLLIAWGPPLLFHLRTRRITAGGAPNSLPEAPAPAVQAGQASGIARDVKRWYIGNKGQEAADNVNDLLGKIANLLPLDVHNATAPSWNRTRQELVAADKAMSGLRDDLPDETAKKLLRDWLDAYSQCFQEAAGLSRVTETQDWLSNNERGHVTIATHKRIWPRIPELLAADQLDEIRLWFERHIDKRIPPEAR
jgi:hypothetical protein